MSYQQVQEYVSLVLYTSNVAVGGPGGNPYSLIATWPKVAKQITFYRDQQRMRGIVFERYDSSMIKLCGSFSDPNPVTITLGEDEQLTRILLYSSTYGNGRFAGLKINTTKKTAEAFAYGYSPCANDEVEIPVGNGKWNGIFGMAGGDIDSFGMAMLTGTT